MTVPAANNTYRRGGHSVSALWVHLVFVTKYRRRILDSAMLDFCQHTMSGVCTDLGAELVEFNGEPEHVHLLVAYPPTLAISTLVRRLKGRSSYAVRREYTGTCVRARMRSHLWSPSYFAASAAGAPLSVIKRYIENQNRPLQHRATPDRNRSAAAAPPPVPVVTSSTDLMR
ncbi:IS200/IS605 family transposase [Mycobacterium kiyosense]|uniref:IS200/IS605 family transposase n=1 Tax=Mycobacterium kiyosense TaxID=2871094 RepID=UPI0022318D14|nr:IS200/IS605 family transposase [Mycobacterium kiyosense]